MDRYLPGMLIFCNKLTGKLGNRPCQKRGVACGVYTTNSPEACQHIFKDCGARLAFVDSQTQLDKILKIQNQCPIDAVIMFNESGATEDNHSGLVKSVCVSCCCSKIGFSDLFGLSGPNF